MAELVIGIAKPKKGSPMGEDEAPASSRSEELDEIDSALDDAFEAMKSGEKTAFKDAMRAAIAACCADMYAEKE